MSLQAAASVSRCCLETPDGGRQPDTAQVFSRRDCFDPPVSQARACGLATSASPGWAPMIADPDDRVRRPKAPRRSWRANGRRHAGIGTAPALPVAVLGLHREAGRHAGGRENPGEGVCPIGAARRQWGIWLLSGGKTALGRPPPPASAGPGSSDDVETGRQSGSSVLSNRSILDLCQPASRGGESVSEQPVAGLSPDIWQPQRLRRLSCRGVRLPFMSPPASSTTAPTTRNGAPRGRRFTATPSPTSRLAPRPVSAISVERSRAAMTPISTSYPTSKRCARR
jgi:hypothetical protein